MANKQITDLSQVNTFEAGDLTLIRKSGRADAKIVFQDIVKSLGNSSVNGFTAVSTAANKITLTPANNGAEIDTYYNGMRISFISPINTDGIVYVDIGALGDKELKIINTNDTAVLSQNDYIEAVYTGDSSTGKFYQTNLKVKSNQISDLTEVNSFTTGDFIGIHKSGAIDDNKLSYNNLVKSLGNSSVFGFNATSTEANKITLTPANGGTTIDSYYEKMIVKFISPINTSGATYIKIGGLPEKQLYKINTSNFSTLTANSVVEAIYISDKFYQTNIAESVIFTNEYNVDSATINAQNTATTYILSSAIGVTKTQYYKGMSIAFTSTIDSKGAIYVNVDGLGLKPIVDPDGDPVPFNFYKDQRVMPVYDGVKFIKHILSDVEPEEPQPDPIVPPQDIVINVGATDILQNIYDKVVKDYGENGGGRKVVLNLPTNIDRTRNFIINKNTPWITIKNNNTKWATALLFENKGNITITGSLDLADAPYGWLAFQDNNTVQQATIIDAVITKGNVLVSPYATFFNITIKNSTLDTTVFWSAGKDIRGYVTIDNCNFTTPPGNYQGGIGQFQNTVSTSITNCNVSSALPRFLLNAANCRNLKIDNISISNAIIFSDNYVINVQQSQDVNISNCNIYSNNTSINLLRIEKQSRVTISSGSFIKNSGASAILVSDSGTQTYISSTVQGTREALNGGQIINI
jgi:hypothetical protein